MARPTTKTDLVEASDTQFARLWALIDSIAPDERSAEFDFSEEFLAKHMEAHWRRDRNLRDVLVHLYEWHELLLQWAKANQDGERRPFLPEPYNWRTYGPMNFEFVEKHQPTSLDEAGSLVKQSHQDAMHMIAGFSNEELFAKGSFPWTGVPTLGSYCVSATSSHYDWAMKKIKAHLKTKK